MLSVGSSEPDGHFQIGRVADQQSARRAIWQPYASASPLVRWGWAAKPPHHARALSLAHSPHFALSPSHRSEAERHCCCELRRART